MRQLTRTLTPWLLCAAACQPPMAATRPAEPPGQPAGQAAQTTPASEDIALARQQARRAVFKWEEFNDAAFARARKEGRFLLLDCVATWCHWCHVMDDTTYPDPELGQLLNERFIALRIDVDARPDIATRYEAWGWPATVIYNPQGE